MRCFKNKYPCIYKATSRTTGRSYIGRTIGDVNHRISQHIHVSKEKYYNNQPLTKFQQALVYLGEEDFYWEVIHQCSDSFKCKKDLNKYLLQKEIEFTLKYDSVENGYNENYGNGEIGYTSQNLTPDASRKLCSQEIFFKRSEKRELQSKELFSIGEERNRIKSIEYAKTKYTRSGPLPKHLNNSIRESKRKEVVNS